MPMLIKTVGGEVYGKCGLVFGEEPVEIDDETLSTVTHRDGFERTVEERLLADPRLVCETVGVEVDAGESGEPTPEPDGTPLAEIGLDIEILEALQDSVPPIATVAAIEAWMNHNTLNDISGIGAKRAQAITAALEAHHAKKSH